MGKRCKPGRRQRLQRRGAPLAERWALIPPPLTVYSAPILRPDSPPRRTEGLTQTELEAVARRWTLRQYRVANSMQMATSEAADFLLDTLRRGDGDEPAGQILRHPRSLARTRARLILQHRRTARMSISAGPTGARRSSKQTADIIEDSSAGLSALSMQHVHVAPDATNTKPAAHDCAAAMATATRPRSARKAQKSWLKRCCSSPDYFLCRVMARRSVLHLEVGRSALYVPELQLYVDSDEISAWHTRITRAVGAARTRVDELEATIADLRLLHRFGRTHLPECRQPWLDEVLAHHGWPMPVACQRGSILRDDPPATLPHA